MVGRNIIPSLVVAILLIVTTYLASLLAPVPFTVRYFSGDFVREYSITTIASVSEAKYFLKGYEDVMFHPSLPVFSGSRSPFDEALMGYTDDFFEENLIIILTLGRMGWSYFTRGINYAGLISIYRNKRDVIILPIGEWTTILLIELDRRMLSTNFRTRFIEIDDEKRRELLLEMNN